jgi:hypothetical protein
MPPPACIVSADSASRLEAEIGHGVVKRARPLLLKIVVLFDGRRRRGDAAKSVLDRLVLDRRGRSGKAVFPPPNGAGNRWQT